MQQMAEAIAYGFFGTRPQKITPLGGGWYGRVFLVEMAGAPVKAIVKIHLVPNLAKKEARQLKALAAHATLKMPDVFYVHKSTPDIPNDAIIMEYIPGFNAGNHHLLEIDEINRAAIAQQIVDNLLSYHGVVNPDGFGEIGASSFEPDFKKWYKPKADGALKKAEWFYAHGKIGDDIFSVIQKAHERYDGIFYMPVTQARLIHGDYNTWNILLDESLTHVSGVIDPLNCCFADSEMDLFQLNHANGKEFQLLDLYAAKSPLSENFPLKKSFYELFDHITGFYDAKVEMDHPFVTALAKELAQQMQHFGLL